MLLLFLSQCSSNSTFRSLDRGINDSIYIYEVKMDHSLYEIKFLQLHAYKYKKFINGQDLIGYDFYDSIENVDSKIHYEVLEDGIQKFYHDEMTGQIREKNSHWMHPPRNEYFRILELNAFPYFVKDKKKWNYDLNFGEHWGDERWITWEGRRTSYSKYKLVDTNVDYDLGEKKIRCFKILAHTKIEGLGKTKSVFYYNEVYGFVYMYFKTINNQIIEFKMI